MVRIQKVARVTGGSDHRQEGSAKLALAAQNEEFQTPNMVWTQLSRMTEVSLKTGDYRGDLQQL